MKTTTLVSKLRNESKEVKTSVGGTKNFRSVMDFVMLNSFYQDDEKMEIVKRSSAEMAELLAKTFSLDVLNDVKAIYSNTNYMAQ